MELLKGRPADVGGREEREIRVYDFLDELGIEYFRTDHEEANTMEKCNEIDRILDTIICKNLFLCNRQKTDFYLLMMPGDKPFKTKDITKQLGCSRLSFASPDFMEECYRPLRNRKRNPWLSSVRMHLKSKVYDKGYNREVFACCQS